RIHILDFARAGFRPIPLAWNVSAAAGQRQASGPEYEVPQSHDNIAFCQRASWSLASQAENSLKSSCDAPNSHAKH
ncbi:hypothetical protein QUT03_22650, partial [Xanthomonas citri pv. citri]